MAGADIDLVREAFHYHSRFAGSVLVFKIDFPVTQEAAFPSLMKDLALLAQTGFKVVIVPGAKEWIDSVLAEYDIASRFIQVEGNAAPLRLTTEESMPFVEMAAFHVATRFMTALSGSRVDSVVGSFVRARGLGVVGGADMERTGRVEKILVKPMSRVLDNGIIPILPCIGWGPSGKSYNVPSDEIALAAAAALGAVKLFIVGAGKTLDAGRLTPKEAEAMMNNYNEGGRTSTDNHPHTDASSPRPPALQTAAQFSATPQMVPGTVSELSLALAAIRAGVERVHLVDGREEGAVLRELFSNLGSGTMVYADEYEAVRPLKTADIPDILRIMAPLVQQGILIRRTSEDILDKKDDYVVYGVDGRAHACAALHRFGDEAEIAAIAVDPAYADLGLGRRVVSYLVNRAKTLGLRRVFVLTTRTQDWFEALGFAEKSADALPAERRKTYDAERKSKVFALEL